MERIIFTRNTSDISSETANIKIDFTKDMTPNEFWDIYKEYL